mgnify:CR=1 FL=1
MNWKNRIFKNWGLMRLIRLVLAGVVLAEAWKSNEAILGLLGIVLLAQSVLNVGCCGSSGCDIDHAANKPRSFEKTQKEVTFSEVTKN